MKEEEFKQSAVIRVTDRASDRLQKKKGKFRGILRDKLVEKSADFAGIFQGKLH